MTKIEINKLMERACCIGADMKQTSEKIHTIASNAQAENLIHMFVKQLEHMRELCSVLSLLDDKHLYECRPVSPQNGHFQEWEIIQY